MKLLYKFFVLTVAAPAIMAFQLTASAEEQAEQKIKFSGSIGLEGSYNKSEPKAGKDVESGGLSASADLGIEVNIEKNVTGFVGLTWEDNDDDSYSLEIDEAYLKLGGNDAMPLFFRAGKMYVPFGKFETCMISDPLTLEIGETRGSAAELGVNFAGFYLSGYAFNGAEDIYGEDDKTDNFGGSIGYAYESDSFSIEIGGSYINSLYEAGGLADSIGEQRDSFVNEDEDYLALKDYVPGAAAYLVLKAAGFSLFGEYVVMLDDPEFEKYDNATSTLDTEKYDAMKAWNIEAGYTFNVAGKETTLGVAYQGVKNAGDMLPETRYSGVLSVGILEGTTFALQYAQDEYEKDATDNDKASSITAKVEIEF